MSDYHFLSNINNKYLFYLFVTYQTLLDTLEDREDNAHDHFIFHILVDTDVNMENAQKYADCFSKFNQASKVSFDLKFYHLDNSCFRHCNCMNRSGKVSQTAYYRLLFAQVIPENVQRILYFDADILLCDDVRNLFSQHPQGDEILYATSEPGYLVNCDDQLAPEPVCTRRAFDNSEPYLLPVRNCIQSGVMLINVEQWRKLDIERKCIETACKWQVIMHDQDLLSMVCTDKVAPLSWEWNINAIQFWICKSGYLELNHNFTLEELPVNDAPTLEQLRQMCQNPKLVHFANVFKPWELTHELSKGKLEYYNVWLPFMTKWLQTYGRFADFFKKHNSALTKAN